MESNSTTEGFTLIERAFNFYAYTLTLAGESAQHNHLLTNIYLNHSNIIYEPCRFPQLPTKRKSLINLCALGKFNLRVATGETGLVIELDRLVPLQVRPIHYVWTQGVHLCALDWFRIEIGYALFCVYAQTQGTFTRRLSCLQAKICRSR